ncbi:MAG: 16S rRNA (guanine(527)-N(7))-methyltransferase RsmG [Elusimicrobiaceae bacterium]|nr:16S rRNA (guanine(527)-N(7))-methyltransferase RsmG [Elusimicrobiaceae bacterium]
MQKKLLDFAAKLKLNLTENAVALLVQYADLVWQKKESLNLTSVADQEEIITRHICDGLVAAAFIAPHAKGKTNFSVADMGSGAGYIGLTVAIALPHIQVSLVESLERRCAFLNWVSMKLGLKNVTVVNIRLGQQTVGTFDAVTERAMGKLNDILPLVAPAVKAGGNFVAYQSMKGEADKNLLMHLQLQEQRALAYNLPGENKERYLAVFSKNGHC